MKICELSVDIHGQFFVRFKTINRMPQKVAEGEEHEKISYSKKEKNQNIQES